MAVKYTEEQLNKFNKAALIQLFLAQQKQLLEIDKKLQLLPEQVAVLNHNRFGRSTEKLAMDDQIAFMEADEKIVFFNKAEAVAALEDAGDDNDESAKPRSRKANGKREEDFKDLPVVSIEHRMTDEELASEFGVHGWKQLPDEVYRRYRFTPAKVEVEEHHVGVYVSKKEDRIVRAKHPGYLLRNSPVSPSLEAAILNAKYVNAVPLYRQEKGFERYGINITRKNMADWTIHCAERYLAMLYGYLHEKLYDCHVIQADETPALVNRDCRPAGSKSICGSTNPGGCVRTLPSCRMTTRGRGRRAVPGSS